ncbi:MAG: histidine kinase [Bacteroidota bacterium]
MLTGALSMQAQHPYYYKIDSENGFPSNEVYQVLQDSFGFVWIGCDAGLFRYDGLSFKQYFHPQQNGRSISHLLLDREQRVWCQNFVGQLFYVESDSMHLFKDFSKEVRAYPKFSIREDELIAGVNNQLRYFDKTGALLSQTPDLHFGAETIIPHQDLLYINSISNIKWSKDNVNFKSIFSKDSLECRYMGKVGNMIYAFVKDLRTSKWQLFKLENRQARVIRGFDVSALNERIYVIKEFGNGFLLGSSNGVFLLNDQFQKAQHFLPGEKITDILYDREGNLWFTSLQSGIYVIPSIQLQIYPEDFFGSNNITALSSFGNELLIGTFNGNIYRFNPKTNERIPIRTPIQYAQKIVRTLVEDDRYLIVSRVGETYLYNKRTGKNNFVPYGNIRSMVLSGDSTFAVTGGSAFMINLASGKYEGYLVLNGAGSAVTQHPQKDTFFLGSKYGLFKYINGQTNPIYWKGQTIYPTSFDWHRDTLWMGTLTNGLLAYYDGDLHAYFLSDDKLRNTNRAIKIYNDYLLVATGLGLMKINLKTQAIDILDETDGLHQREIIGIEAIDSTIYLATTKGLVQMPIKEMQQNTAKPHLSIERVVVNDSLEVTKLKRKLRYYENNIRIYFQTALFRSRGNFHYEYRLLGLNDDWGINSGQTTALPYRALPAGQYTFELRVVNEDQVKSDIQRFSFEIVAPVWQRWWFLGLVLLLIISLVYWRIQNRIAKIRRQAKIENELKTSQLTALKAQMNPHFLYNALNSIQDLILEEDVKNASRYLAKFSHLMRQILDASENQVIPLSEELKMLHLYLTLEKLRFGENFEYTIDLSSNIQTETLLIPPMIIQPFIENAVKHGLLHKTKGTKKIHIRLEKKESLECTIIDNGVGREKANAIQKRQGKSNSSFATSATQKRLQILNQTYPQKIGLEISDLYQDKKASGTKVVLRIPLNAHS